MPDTIVLAAGTERVTLRDIPSLIADALHPAIPEGTPRVLAFLKKEAHAQELADEWCGRGNNFPVSLTDEDMQSLNGGPWAKLPPLFLMPDSDSGPRELASALNELQWQDYRTAIEANPPADWRIIAYWRDLSLQQSVWHHEVASSHAEELKRQCSSGAIAPKSPFTRIAVRGVTGDALLDCFLTVAEFTEYASQFALAVRIEREFTRKPLAAQLVDELRQEAPAQRVRVREEGAPGKSAVSSMTVADHLAELVPEAEAQASGILRVDRAAKLIADAGVDHNVESLIESMTTATIYNSKTKERQRLVRHPDRMPLRLDEKAREFSDVVKVTDVDEWLEALGLPDRLSPLLHSLPSRTPATPRPVQRFAAQEHAILAAITEKGIDPKALPARPAGKPGVKAMIRAALDKTPLFQGASIFEAAWERLRKAKDIQGGD